MPGLITRLLSRRSVRPERFELTAATRSSSWSLQWENDQLGYCQILPPITIFPTPGSEPKDQRVAITVTDDQWRTLWKIMEQIEAWNWSGNYSWADKIQVIGGPYWKVNISRGDRRLECKGGASADTAPPSFVRFVETIGSIAGEDKRGLTRLLKSLRDSAGNS